MATLTIIRYISELVKENLSPNKPKNLKSALDLHFFYYNFMQIHQTLRVIPAIESKITDHIWTWQELLTGSRT